MSVGRHSAVDRILDRTVALGYSRIGYVIRRRWWQDEPAPGSLGGKHVLITGSTSGIGRAAAARCAASGAEVHVHGHNPERGAQAISWLTSRVPRGIFHLESCDLQSLADVQRFAEDFSRRVPALHALVHNAGVMSPEREETVDGHERTLAVHVLSPHLLTDLLRGSLAGAEGGRIVFMSSGGMYAQKLPAADLEFEKDKYSGSAAYARTKRMQVTLAELWATELAEAGTAVHAMHPGWVDTSGVRTYLPKFRLLTRPFIRTPDQGADTLACLLSAPQVQPWTGGFWHDRSSRPTHYFRRTKETDADRRALWDYCSLTVSPFTRHPGLGGTIDSP